MQPQERVLLDFIHNSAKLKPGQIIIGEKRHPRLIKKVYPEPDYVKKYKRKVAFFKVACLLKGRCVIVINGRTYALKPGDLCIIRPGADNYESYFRKNTGYEIAWFLHMKVSNLKVNFTRYSPDSSWKMLAFMNFNYTPEKYFTLEDIFTLKKAEQTFENIKARVMAWLACLPEKMKDKGYFTVKRTPEYDKQIQVKENRISAAIEFVDKHYKEDITLEEVATQVSLGRNYFSNLFSEVSNLTLSEYISILRFREAALLIRETSFSINEIGYKVGYKDPAFFRRMFKKHTGLAPLKYRNRELLP